MNNMGRTINRADWTLNTDWVAYIALLASRLPWFLGGAAPAAAGAGYETIEEPPDVTKEMYQIEHKRNKIFDLALLGIILTHHNISELIFMLYNTHIKSLRLKKQLPSLRWTLKRINNT